MSDALAIFEFAAAAKTNAGKASGGGRPSRLELAFADALGDAQAEQTNAGDALRSLPHCGVGAPKACVKDVGATDGHEVDWLALHFDRHELETAPWGLVDGRGRHVEGDVEPITPRAEAQLLNAAALGGVGSATAQALDPTKSELRERIGAGLRMPPGQGANGHPDGLNDAVPRQAFQPGLTAGDLMRAGPLGNNGQPSGFDDPALRQALQSGLTAGDLMRGRLSGAVPQSREGAPRAASDNAPAPASPGDMAGAAERERLSELLQARPGAILDDARQDLLQQQGSAPEQIATAMATLQEFGEDAGGNPRLAAPNAPPGADPQSSLQSTARTAIPPMAAEIASQARNGIRQFEIRLDPPELGRVEVTLDFRRDGSMAAKLVVERPETLDLLMRDARALEKTLQSGGLKLEDGAIDYQLKDQSAFQRQDQSNPELRASTQEDDPSVQAADDDDGSGQTAWRTVPTALDIRI